MRAENDERVSIENPPCIELVGMTEPCASDLATRTQFMRRCDHHLADLQCASTMDKRIVYLGEWHTHPQQHPTPSGIDVGSWQKAFKNKIAVVTIVGQVTDWWWLWMGDKVLRIENGQQAENLTADTVATGIKSTDSAGKVTYRKEYGERVGAGPNGGAQTQVKVHQDSS